METLISKQKLEECVRNVKNAGDTLRSVDKYIESSILVIFINNENKKESNILITQRKNNLRKHAGQVAFPGGRKELHDKNLLETAIMETEE